MPLLIETFQNQIIPKVTITMTAKWPGCEHFFLNQTHIHGSSIFMTVAQITFQFGFTIGGPSLAMPCNPAP